MTTDNEQSQEVEQQENNKKQRVIGKPFPKGVSGNPNGRPIETPEQKLVKKAAQEFIEEHKEQLAASLPQISPVLIAKALGGDILAIKDIEDRVMGKPITPLAGEFKHEITAFKKYNELET